MGYLGKVERGDKPCVWQSAEASSHDLGSCDVGICLATVMLDEFAGQLFDVLRSKLQSHCFVLPK